MDVGNKYTIDIVSLDVQTGKFTTLDVIDTFRNLSYQLKLNDISTCSFDLDIFDPKLTRTNFVPKKNQIVLKRNGVPIFVGPYIAPDGNFQDVEGQTKIQCYSYLYHLVNRYTAKIKQYPRTNDIATTAWDLINTTQSKPFGNLSIFQGNNALTGITKPRTYQYKSVGAAIKEFADLIGGFDFELVPIMDSNNYLSYIKFNTYYPKMGSVRDDLPTMKLGDNVNSFGFGSDGELYTSGIAEGAGTGESTLISTLDNYYLQIAYTRTETIKSYKDLNSQIALNDALGWYLNRVSTPKYNIRFDVNPATNPTFGDFNLGDTLNLDFDIRDVEPTAGDFVNFKGQGRIIQIDINVDEQGVDTIVPTVEFFN